MSAAIITSVESAAAAIRGGRLVAFATETVYGLGADALDPSACARIFEAKQRPAFDPLIVHIAEASMLEVLAENVPEVARQLMDRFWPGPLTLVLPKRAVVPELVTSGLPTVAVRMPGHEQARELIRLAGCPVAAPSANLFGQVSPTTAQHVAQQLGDRIDLILDGGPCRVGVESTVVDVTGAVPLVLRPGGTTVEDLRSAVGTVEFRAVTMGEQPAPAPGMLMRHYSPSTPLRPWQPDDPLPTGRIGLLTWQAGPADDRFQKVIDLSPAGDLVEAAAGLFAAMRELDAAGLDVILVTPFPDHGLGLAINDRLRRASARDPHA